MLFQYGFEDGVEHIIFGKIELCITRWCKEMYLSKGKIVEGDYLVSWAGRAEEELGI